VRISLCTTRGCSRATTPHRFLQGLIGKAADVNLLTFSSGGVAGATQNIFAVDGNTAGSAGIAEMLLQSHDGEIVLLPALPAAWPTGSVQGLCARGGFIIDMHWHDGKLRSVVIRSRNRGSARVRYDEQSVKLNFQRGESRHLSPATWHNRAAGAKV
jgi:alpha-L-fucosidase 2